MSTLSVCSSSTSATRSSRLWRSARRSWSRPGSLIRRRVTDLVIGEVQRRLQCEPGPLRLRVLAPGRAELVADERDGLVVEALLERGQHPAGAFARSGGRA